MIESAPNMVPTPVLRIKRNSAEDVLIEDASNVLLARMEIEKRKLEGN